MPVLVIYGMPEFPQPKNMLEKLIDDLKWATVSVEELQLDVADISVFMPIDRVTSGLGEELVCFVKGLHKKPSCTIEARRKLANKIQETLLAFARQYLGKCDFMEVFIEPFDQITDGYAASLISDTWDP